VDVHRYRIHFVDQGWELVRMAQPNKLKITRGEELFVSPMVLSAQP
jgi:hypothetical protein